MTKKAQTFIRHIEPIEVRRARHAAEAPVATKEYQDRAKAALARMATLKVERLARDKKTN